MKTVGLPVETVWEAKSTANAATTFTIWLTISLLAVESCTVNVTL